MSLSYAMLGFLTYKPMTGYNLKKIFDKSIYGVWTANLSQIYRELNNLEKKGYVSSSVQKQEDRPDKRVYHITEDGKTAFQGWLSNFPESFSVPKRDEFMLRIFFGSKLEKKQLINEFKRFILQKKEYLTTLSEIEKNFKKYVGDFEVGSIEKEELFWHFTVKRAIMSLEVIIRWAEECIEELEAYEDA